MRPEQGWSSRSGHAEAGGGGRDPRCPRERYRGIRPRYRQNFAEKILSNLFAYQKTALTRFRRLVALDPRRPPACRSRGALGENWQRARQAGVLSLNNMRREGGWPASNDPTSDSIEPPVAENRPTPVATTRRQRRRPSPMTTRPTIRVR
jgi:hypothetical protein